MGFDGKMMFSKIDMVSLSMEWSLRLVDLVTPFNLSNHIFSYSISTSIDQNSTTWICGLQGVISDNYFPLDQVVIVLLQENH